MNLFGVMDVSGSALRAERVRAEVVASNMANSETTRTPEGGPYQRHHVVFEAEGGESFQESLTEQMHCDLFGAQVGGAMNAHFHSVLNAQPAAANGAPNGVAVTG